MIDSVASALGALLNPERQDTLNFFAPTGDIQAAAAQTGGAFKFDLTDADQAALTEFLRGGPENANMATALMSFAGQKAQLRSQYAGLRTDFDPLALIQDAANRGPGGMRQVIPPAGTSAYELEFFNALRGGDFLNAGIIAGRQQDYGQFYQFMTSRGATGTDADRYGAYVTADQAGLDQNIDIRRQQAMRLMSATGQLGLTTRFTQQAQGGIDTWQFVTARQAATDTLGFGDEYRRLLDEESARLDRLPGETEEQYADRVNRLQAGGITQATMNRLSRRYGFGQFGLDQVSQWTTEQTEAYAQATQTQGMLAPYIRGANMAPSAQRVNELIAGRQYADAYELMGRQQQANQMFMNYASYGGATGANFDIMQSLLAAPPSVSRQLLAAASGDPLATSRHVMATGMTADNAYMYLQQTPGEGGTAGMFAGYDVNLRQAKYQPFVQRVMDTGERYGATGRLMAQAGGLDWGGISQMNYVETSAMLNSMQLQQMMLGQSQEQLSLARRREMTFGSGFSTMGVGVEGSGLDIKGVIRDLAKESGLLTAVDSITGTSLLSGIAGLTEWGQEDKSIRLQREQQNVGMEYQTWQMRQARTRFDVEGQQWMERYGLREQQTATQLGWQQRDIGRSQFQQTTQAGWQLEDILYQRGRNQLQFGWQMEDYDRNLRYARGRERLDLMRQRERSVIGFAMDMGQSGREEERQRTRMGWMQEEQKIERDRFEQNKRWTLESMQMDKRHFDQSRNLQNEELKQREQMHQNEIKWMGEQREIEDQNRMLRRAQTMLEIAEMQNLQQVTQQMALNMGTLSKHLEDMQTSNREAEATMTTLAKTGDILKDIANSLGKISGYYQQGGAKSSGTGTKTTTSTKTVKTTTTIRGGPQLPPGDSLWAGFEMGGWTGPEELPGFDDGGWTGLGTNKTPKGIVHANEIVVPEDGMAVVRGDSGQNDRLDRIYDVLVKILERTRPGVTMNIQANDVRAAAKGGLTEYERTYGRLS
jgi:hypothetical protein